MKEHSSSLATTGRRILDDALLATGPTDLNLAAHRVIHALLVGDFTPTEDVEAGGHALASRLVFGVIGTQKLPPTPGTPALGLAIAVLPDAHWSAPLSHRTPDAIPVSSGNPMRLKIWTAGITHTAQKTLAMLLSSGFRWSPRIQEALSDSEVAVDAGLVGWLEGHAAVLSVCAPPPRTPS